MIEMVHIPLGLLNNPMESSYLPTLLEKDSMMSYASMTVKVSSWICFLMNMLLKPLISKSQVDRAKFWFLALPQCYTEDTGYDLGKVGLTNLGTSDQATMEECRAYCRHLNTLIIYIEFGTLFVIPAGTPTLTRQSTSPTEGWKMNADASLVTTWVWPAEIPGMTKSLAMCDVLN